MDIEINGRLVRLAVCFAAAFAAVMFLFIRKPHIVKSRNRYIRAAMAFALAFVPGVLAASLCAKTITTLYDSIAGNEPGITSEAEEREETEEERENERDE